LGQVWTTVYYETVQQRLQQVCVAAQSVGSILTRESQGVGCTAAVSYLLLDDLDLLRAGELAAIRFGPADPDCQGFDGGGVLVADRGGFGIVDGGQRGSQDRHCRAVALLHRRAAGLLP
jgi:hypothetical protein